jgi:DNA-directed RNA polymerase alpha subunit
MPSIRIAKTIPSQLCEKFANCFSPGVIEIDEDDSGAKTVRVANPRKDTLSREVYRHPEFRDGVELGRVRDHYICKDFVELSTDNHAALLSFSISSQHRIMRPISS